MELRVLSEPDPALFSLESVLPDARKLADRRCASALSRATCRPGCAMCCRHLVPLAPAEARRLRALIATMPATQRQRVFARFLTLSSHLERAGLLELLAELASDPASVPADGRAWLAKEYFEQRLDCPFLEDERCSIYEERPIACRLQAVSSEPRHCRQGGSTVKPIASRGRPAVRVLAELEGSHWLPLPLLFDADLPASRYRPQAEWLSALVAGLDADSVVS